MTDDARMHHLEQRVTDFFGRNRSGSEPTYLPLTNTSCAGLVLLDAANALEAVAITMAAARTVLVNMVVSPAGLSVTPASGVPAHLEPARWCGESPGGPGTGLRNS